MQPTIGRIVIYRTLNGFDCAAIITAVAGERFPKLTGSSVHLHVFLPPDTAGDYIDDGGAPEGTGPGSWRWPERV